MRDCRLGRCVLLTNDSYLLATAKDNGLVEPDAKPATREKQLRSLQAGRGIAATAVLLHHAAFATEQFVAPLPDFLSRVFNCGLLGVDFFFVLSGFIILNAHFDDPPKLAALKLYAFKRIVRIYVPYLPITLVLVTAYLFLPEMSRNTRDWGWLITLLLIPSREQPALAAAWTLVHEMVFYAIFILYFVSRRAFIAVIVCWAAAMLIQPMTYVQDGQAGEPLTAVILNPINVEFCLGLACAVGYRCIGPRWIPWLVAAGLCLVVAFFALCDKVTINNFRNPAHIVFGLGMAMLILGLTLQEKTHGLAVPKSLAMLGDASYAIYLIHVPVISVAIRVSAHLPLLGGWLPAMCFSSCCAAIAGIAYYGLFERPALAAIRQATYRPKSLAPTKTSDPVTPL